LDARLYLPEGHYETDRRLSDFDNLIPALVGTYRISVLGSRDVADAAISSKDLATSRQARPNLDPGYANLESALLRPSAPSPSVPPADRQRTLSVIQSAMGKMTLVTAIIATRAAPTPQLFSHEAILPAHDQLIARHVASPAARATARQAPLDPSVAAMMCVTRLSIC
jgi:hypothetical protein